MPYNIRDVATRAGVSPSTVSRVIAGHPRISLKTRERVQAVMREMNYHPNAIARSLVRKSSQAIGLLIPNSVEQFFLNPFFPEFLRGVTQVVQEANYNILLSTALHGLSEVERLEQMVSGRHADGVILTTARQQDPLIAVLESHHLPAVVVGRPPAGTNVAWVNNDNRRAAYDITMHFAKHGHRRIGFICGSFDLVVTLDRLAGYQDALREAGIGFDPNLMASGEFLEEVGYHGMTRLLAVAERPTAVVAADDVLAFGAMRAAGELGYRIPEDMAIAGFNDIPLARLANPPMTTVSIRMFELGQMAANLLIEQFQDPCAPRRGVIVPHDLVIRRSCGGWDPFAAFSG